MSENEMPDIEKMIENLSEEDIEELKKAAQSFFGDSGAPDPPPASNGGGFNFADMAMNAEMLGKINMLMSAMNKSDSRSNLIAALKPLLSEPRRKKADEALQMLRLMEILPLLQKEFGDGYNNE